MENKLNLRPFWVSIRHRLWLVLGSALLAGIVAYIATSYVPPTYRASMTLMIQQSPSPSISDYTAILISERQASTYAEIIKEELVIQTMIAQLGLDLTPEEVQRKLDVELVRNTQLIRLQIEDSDGYRAARMANGIGDALIAQSQTLQEARYADSLESIQAQMQDLTALIEEMTSAVDALESAATDENQAELAQLQTILAGYRNSYTSLLQTYEQTRLTAVSSADNVVILSRAQEPAKRIGPSGLKNALLATVATAVLALGVIFIIEYLDDTVKTPDDVKLLLDDITVLGVIGQLGKKDTELVTLAQPRSPISESFRALRTNIRFTSIDKPIKTLLVTSSGPSEGKSLVISNLAVTMAQAGMQVIIVDADLRRPRIHKVFNHGNSSGGLTETLLEGELNGRLQTTPSEGLNMLVAGELPPNPAELIGSQKMQDLLKLLTQQVDIVLIDSPPVLAVTDAVVLAREVDAVLVVATAGQTRRNNLKQGVNALRQVEANVIGVALNKVATTKGSYYYYYQ